MIWAQSLKRVFLINIGVCEYCGGAVRIIASIEDPAVIEKILTHMERRDAAASPQAPRAAGHLGRRCAIAPIAPAPRGAV